MYDPKFEKAIQQKMEELEFRPAEAVWVNIEKAVSVDKRRRAGFVWRYLLAGVFLAAAAGLYLYFAHTKTVGKAVVAKAPALGGSTASSATGAAGGSATSSAAASAGAVAGKALSGDVTGQASAYGASSDAHQANPGAAGNRSTGKSARGISGRQVNRGSATAGSGKANFGNDIADGPVAADGTDEASVETPAIVQTSSAGAVTAVAGSQRLPQYFYSPALAGQRLMPQVQGRALATKKSYLVALAAISRPAGHWEAGFMGGGGLSRLNKLNVTQAQAALAPSATSLYNIVRANNVSANVAGGKTTLISDTRADASFDGGIYLQRSLTSRLIFNTGMNLHYYSNRISVGQQLTTYVQAAFSYVIPTTLPSTQNASIYSAGDIRSFTNKYYFLELPVALQWKVSKNRILPIFLEGGLSLSRLMGASALFYNAKTGLYSKDGDVVDKTQLDISSALLFGLPFHGIGIQLGPVVQYGLTPLMNTQGLGDQHLLYTGIRVVVIPGRK